MAVIALVGSDEIVAGNSIAREVASQFRVGTDMRDAISIVRVVRAGDIIEIGEWIVADGVSADIRERDIGSADVFLVGLPRNASVIQQCDEMIRRRLMIHRGIIVVENAEIRAGLEPEIIRQAGMQAGWCEVLTAIGCHRQQRLIDIRRVGAVLNGRPILIFQKDNEYRLNRRQLARKGNRRNRKGEKKNNTSLHGKILNERRLLRDQIFAQITEALRLTPLNYCHS